MSEANDMSCAELADAAAELALGVLTGRERAEALAHLDHCEACREHVRQLTMTGEELLGLLPPREPPAGFETRVMERLGLSVPEHQPAGRIGPISRFRRLFGKPAGSHAGATGGTAGRAGRKPAGLGRGTWLGGSPRRLLAATAVLLAVIAAGLGGWGLRATTSPGDRPAELRGAGFRQRPHGRAALLLRRQPAVGLHVREPARGTVLSCASSRARTGSSRPSGRSGSTTASARGPPPPR